MYKPFQKFWQDLSSELKLGWVGLNIVLGVFIGSFGAFTLWLRLVAPATPNMSQLEYNVAFLLSTGIAMTILGIRAVRQNLAYRKRGA